MWIRSQNKKRLLNASYIRANGNEIEAIQANEYCTKIASYSTEAKALKVLDMIEQAINKVEEFKAQGENVVRNIYGSSSERLQKFTFQMPQDDEVKEDEH